MQLTEVIQRARRKPGWGGALLIALYLVKQGVSGGGFLHELLDVLLLFTALSEVRFWQRQNASVLLNPVTLTVLFFVLIVFASCVLSPLPRVSFDEIKTPIIKSLLVMPFAFCVVAVTLWRRGWQVEQISALIVTFLAFSAVAEILWIFVAYGRFWLDFGSMPIDPYFHRYKVGEILIVFPFVISVVFRSQGVRALSWSVLGVLLFAAVATSNSRGAWLGMLVSIIYLLFANRSVLRNWQRKNRKTLIAAIAAMMLIFLILAGSAQVGQILVRVASGLDTSARYGSGVWGATLDLIKDKPWFGYGYGDQIYVLAYNTQAPLHPEWIARVAIGAHNALLMHWMAAGIPGVVSLLALYLGFMVGVVQLLRRDRGGWRAGLIHSCCAAFLSYYAVRGQFENVHWNSFGLLTAMLIWLYVIPATDGGNDAGVS